MPQFSDALSQANDIGVKILNNLMTFSTRWIYLFIYLLEFIPCYFTLNSFVLIVVTTVIEARQLNLWEAKVLALLAFNV